MLGVAGGRFENLQSREIDSPKRGRVSRYGSIFQKVALQYGVQCIGIRHHSMASSSPASCCFSSSDSESKSIDTDFFDDRGSCRSGVCERQEKTSAAAPVATAEISKALNIRDITLKTLDDEDAPAIVCRQHGIR